MSSAQNGRPASSTIIRRVVVPVVGAGLLLGAGAGMASAKEVASGGTPVAPAGTCNPVSSLTYKGDARAGETGLASISANYGVKPCVKGQAVTVDARLYLTADPSAIAYDDAAAPLKGKFTVLGVKANTSYLVSITVTDSTTGAVLGTKAIYAAAVYKGV